MAPDTPPLAELLARFLSQQAAARDAGIAEMPVGEVEPYEAAPFPLIEPRAAWKEAFTAIELLDPEQAAMRLSPPADWVSLVTAPLSLGALPLAAGHFPQLVRDLPALIRTTRRADLWPKPLPPLGVEGLETWAAQAVRRREYPLALLAIGTLRLARHLDRAAALLEELRPDVPGRWSVAFGNEEAALAWQKGEADAALEIWNKLPDSGPVCFNRGIAALFCDRPAEARAALTQAIALLPEDSSWQHLGRLYLALTQI